MRCLAGTSFLEASIAHRCGQSRGTVHAVSRQLDEMVDDDDDDDDDGAVRCEQIDAWAESLERRLALCDETTTSAGSYSCDESHK
jgi:hypothetical protein